MDSFFNDLNSFNNPNRNNKLKDRMRTKILQVKELSEQKRLIALAADYIRLRKEL